MTSRLSQSHDTTERFVSRLAVFLFTTSLVAMPALADHGGSDHYILYSVSGTIDAVTGIKVDDLDLSDPNIDQDVVDDLASIGIVVGAPFAMSQIVREDEPGELVQDCITPIGSAVFYPTSTFGLYMKVGELTASNFKRGNGVGVSNDAVFSIVTIDAFTLNASEGETNIPWLVQDHTPASAPCVNDGKGAGYFGLSLFGNTFGNVMSSTDLPLPGALPDITAWPADPQGSNKIALDLIDLTSGKTVTLNAEALSLTASRVPRVAIPTLPPIGVVALSLGLVAAGAALVRSRSGAGRA